MELVTKEEFKELVNNKAINNIGFSDIVFQLLKLNKINELYDKNYDKNSPEFIDAILNYLGVSYTVDENDLKKIPKSGPFIIISNHPFGALDGLILSKIIPPLRPDFKFIANFLLQRITPLKDNFFPVNPFENNKDASSSIAGLRKALDYVKSGNSIGIFPAGEVSVYNKTENRIADKEWVNSIIKFIIKCNVPIVPIYIAGNNSNMFYLLSQISPMLRTAKLPSELFNKKNLVVPVKIGNPINIADLSHIITDSRDVGRYLRAKTYALGTKVPVDHFYKPPVISTKKNKQSIINDVATHLLLKDIDNLKKENLLAEANQFQVYCASVEQLPNIIFEIGRLREITFREISEGTNKNFDLDQYDIYYQHLFIWDKENKKIVGSYRIGLGKDIISVYGKKGFYISSLFKIDNSFNPVLEQCVELGRSFIVKEYQKNAIILFLLWKGIFKFLLLHKECRFLLGPVSISDKFSDFTKSLIVTFVTNNYYNNELASMIKPRKKFTIKNKYMPDIANLLHNSKNIDKLNKLVVDIEEQNNVPVLLKKYLSINAKIIGFNIDPHFNNCLGMD